MTVWAYVDVESTSLHVDLGGEPWEVGLVRHDDTTGHIEERSWHLPVDLGKADPMSLRVGGLVGRWQPGDLDEWSTVRALQGFAEEFMRLTWDAVWVGCVPSFDERFLAPLLRRWGACPGWHYQLVDVETLAVGYLTAQIVNGNWVVETAALITPPWSSNDLSRAVGVDPDRYARHTALGDARWAQAIHRKVYLDLMPRAAGTPNLDDCEHESASGVDDAPIGSADKVWRCDACGFLFREEPVPGSQRFTRRVPVEPPLPIEAGP